MAGLVAFRSLRLVWLVLPARVAAVRPQRWAAAVEAAVRLRFRLGVPQEAHRLRRVLLGVAGRCRALEVAEVVAAPGMVVRQALVVLVAMVALGS